MCHCTFFFNDTATTEIYTLSLHDALPIFQLVEKPLRNRIIAVLQRLFLCISQESQSPYFQKLQRSEEHTSELQSRQYLVCRLLLEKKKSPKPAPSGRADGPQHSERDVQCT